MPPRHHHHHGEEEEIKVELKKFKFDFANRPTPTIIASGSRGAGKSNLLLSLLSQFKHIKRFFVMCGNRSTFLFWSKALGSSATVMLVNNHNVDDAIAMWEKIKAEQEELVAKYEYLGIPFPDSDILTFVFDDVGTHKKISRSNMIDEMVSNGRHLKVIMCISPQHPTMLSPEARSGADYIFILRNSRGNLDFMYNETIKGEVSPSQFTKIVRTVTKQRDREGRRKHQALVIDMLQVGESLDVLFSIYAHDAKAVPFESIQLGDAEWREYNRQHYVDVEKEKIAAKLERERLEQFKQQRHASWSQYGVSSMPLSEDTPSDPTDDYDRLVLHGMKKDQPTIQIVIPKNHSSTEEQPPQSSTPYSSQFSQYQYRYQSTTGYDNGSYDQYGQYNGQYQSNNNNYPSWSGSYNNFQPINEYVSGYVPQSYYDQSYVPQYNNNYQSPSYQPVYQDTYQPYYSTIVT